MTLILNPADHFSAVKDFQKFFSFASKNPTRQFLREILHYFSKIPYENISKIIKSANHHEFVSKIRLPEEIISDHISFHLGGTCYSLTFFLYSVLTHFGFSCYPISAHMKRRMNVHSALIVLIDGKKYLVDPGYLFDEPILLNPAEFNFQTVSHTNVFAIFNPQDSYFHIYTLSNFQKKWRYCFRDKVISEQEFVQYWENSFSPEILNGICLNSIQSDKMIYLQNNFLQISSHKIKQKKNIKENYSDFIKETFGISPQFVEKSRLILSQKSAR
ncbi:MAG: hypothetical protein DRZ79_01340 [Candidatus Cloacimonadota bacterium]|nr:MAG: hypothetical protein DRZ79_01340 [Candidatus Cloacimonadota bacterium]